jgi:hypothetical protein
VNSGVSNTDELLTSRAVSGSDNNIQALKPKVLPTKAKQEIQTKKVLPKKTNQNVKLDKETKSMLDNTIKAYDKLPEQQKILSYEYIENMQPKNKIEENVKKEFLRVIERPKNLKKKGIDKKNITIDEVPF